MNNPQQMGIDEINKLCIGKKIVGLDEENPVALGLFNKHKFVSTSGFRICIDDGTSLCIEEDGGIMIYILKE